MLLIVAYHVHEEGQGHEDRDLQSDLNKDLAVDWKTEIQKKYLKNHKSTLQWTERQNHLFSRVRWEVETKNSHAEIT